MISAQALREPTLKSEVLKGENHTLKYFTEHPIYYSMWDLGTLYTLVPITAPPVRVNISRLSLYNTSLNSLIGQNPS